jgi:hypothetical protein
MIRNILFSTILLQFKSPIHQAQPAAAIAMEILCRFFGGKDWNG